jgi:hypothetical protein
MATAQINMKTLTNLSRGSRFSQYHNADGNLCRQGLSCRMEELAGLRSERETRVTETISDVQDPQHKTKKQGAEVSAIRFYSAIAAPR